MCKVTKSMQTFTVEITHNLLKCNRSNKYGVHRGRLPAPIKQYNMIHVDDDLQSHSSDLEFLWRSFHQQNLSWTTRRELQHYIKLTEIHRILLTFNDLQITRFVGSKSPNVWFWLTLPFEGATDSRYILVIIITLGIKDPEGFGKNWNKKL